MIYRCCCEDLHVVGGHRHTQVNGVTVEGGRDSAQTVGWRGLSLRDSGSDVGCRNDEQDWLYCSRDKIMSLQY